jgi:hypothetical protein
MGRPVGSHYKIDMSHQEVERLLEELEGVREHACSLPVLLAVVCHLCIPIPAAQWLLTLEGAEWVSVEAAANWLCHDLG